MRQRAWAAKGQGAGVLQGARGGRDVKTAARAAGWCGGPMRLRWGYRRRCARRRAGSYLAGARQGLPAPLVYHICDILYHNAAVPRVLRRLRAFLPPAQAAGCPSPVLRPQATLSPAAARLPHQLARAPRRVPARVQKEPTEPNTKRG